jgi:hypothetical protein
MSVVENNEGTVVSNEGTVSNEGSGLKLHRGPYVENEGWVPTPTDQYGNVVTTDNGSPDANIRNVTDVFDVADRNHLAVAAKALDPEDPTPAELVNLPTGATIVTADPQVAIDRVKAAAAKAAEEAPVPVTTTTDTTTTTTDTGTPAPANPWNNATT